MFKRPSQLICLILAGQFICLPFQATSFAKQPELFDPHKVSVAVLSYPSNPKDRPFIEEVSEAVRLRLQQIPYFKVVKPETAQTLVSYHQDYIKEGVVLTDAERYLGLSKTHWFDREYREAEVTVNHAIDLFRKQTGKGALLVDALLTKAVILQDQKRYEESRALFEEVLRINPNLTMEGLPITGRSRRIFNRTNQDVRNRNSGNLEVTSNPPAATLYLNGIKKGVTPLRLNALPQGSYLLTLEASHYNPTYEPVVVAANTTQFVNRKLQWVANRTGKGQNLGVPEKTNEVIQKEIKWATKIGETLKVDKVILVSSEKVGKEELLITRTIDTALQAAYNPVGIPFSEMLNDKEKSVNKIAENLDDQAKLHVLNNPKEYLQPDMGNIRVLRHKKPFYKTPVFYTLVGLVVGGAAGSTLGVLLTQDNNNGGGDAGGVVINFE